MENKENKEIKNKQTEELNDEALDGVTGGVYQPIGVSGKTAKSPKTVPSKPAVGGGVTVPTAPGSGDIRTF